MKFSILQENLLQATSTAGRSAGAKASLPILGHLLLATDQGRLKISATNLEIGVNIWVGAKVEKEGTIAVPARIFQDLLSSLPPGKIALEVTKGSLHIAAGGVEANIAGIDGSEFPAVPAFPKAGAVTFPASSLAAAVESVAYAAAAEEGRPILTGILWRVTGGMAELTATDGYRLAKVTITLPDRKGEWQAVVPARTMSEVARITAELTARGEGLDEVSLALSEGDNQISFSVGGVELSSRLLEGQYPSVEAIIPTEATLRGIFSRTELLQAVRLAAVFAKDLGSIVKLKLDQAGATLSGSTAQVGDEQTEIPGTVEGEEMEVAFNSRYLQDALSRMSTEQVSFEIKSPTSPGVLHPVGDEKLLVLVMPVRLTN